jgi:hypothetical protein
VQTAPPRFTCVPGFNAGFDDPDLSPDLDWPESEERPGSLAGSSTDPACRPVAPTKVGAPVVLYDTVNQKGEVTKSDSFLGPCSEPFVGPPGLLQSDRDGLAEWYELEVGPTQISSGRAETATLRIPPGAPTPRIRKNLKTRVAYVRCNYKRFSPLEFSGFIGASTVPVHTSHSLAGGRGVVWCWHCGKFSVERSVGLTKPCAEPSGYGLLNLRRLRAGKPPSSLGKWPVNDDSPFRQLIISQ